MEAGCGEHVLLVDGGEVLPVHVDVFSHQAQPAGLLEGLQSGLVARALHVMVVAILEAPQRPSKTCVDSFSLYLK